jgi:putative MATE family efflux protein
MAEHAPGEEMSDLGIAEIPVDEDERPLPPPRAPVMNALVDGRILPTLLRLAWPNVIALSAGTCVVIAETSYIGRLGVESLAAMALVFPCVILTMTMSGGAMGGGVASAIARALGAGDVERASALASHALLIGVCFGATFMLGMLLFGPQLLELLGGRGNVLKQAVAYSQIFFGGAVLPWLMNTMAGVLRGTGNMKLPSMLILNSAVCQIILGGTLGLGLGPIPQFGMRGVAAGSLTAYMISISIMSWYLFSGRARVKPKIGGLRIRAPMFFDILKVGAVSCFSPLQSVLTISIFTHMLAGFGTAILAGYGVGARLEFMLTSVAFSFGIASVPMIGMAIGAERIARARRIAWTAGLVSFISVGAVATVIAMVPDLWVNIFTSDAAVRAASRQYLSTAAPCYAFIGLAMSMYFSSQGAAKVLGPVLAQSGRLGFIAAGGWYLTTREATAANFFALAASSMVLLGVLSSASVALTRWGPKREASIRARLSDAKLVIANEAK